MKSKKPKSPWSANVSTSITPASDRDDMPDMLEYREDYGIDSLREEVLAPAHTTPLAAVSRSRGAHAPTPKKGVKRSQ